MIPLKDQEILRQKFAQELVNPVKIEFFTERELSIYVPGRQPCQYCKPTQQMLEELAALTDRISLRTHILAEEPEEARRYGVDKVPAIVLRPDGRLSGRRRDSRDLKFYGLPAGMEFVTFVETIVDVSRGTSLLSPQSKKKLRKLKEAVRLQVFVTPTCPYCPQMARLAYQMALESPHIAAEVVEISEFPDMARHYRVRAVPLTVISAGGGPASGGNKQVALPGAMPESEFVEQVLKAATGKAIAEPGGTAGPASPAEQPPQRASRGKRPSGLIIP